MKLFGKERIDNYSSVYYIFGFKIKITDYKRQLKDVSGSVYYLNDVTRKLSWGAYPSFKLNKNDYEILRAAEFYEKVGYFPDFKNPKTFYEKINWLYINYFNPLQNFSIDKFTAKKFFEEKVGKEYVIPLLGVWDNVNDIDFSVLPEKFIMKSTHSACRYGVRIIDNKVKEDMDKLKYDLNNLLFYGHLGSVPNLTIIKQRLIAEEYIDGINYDYKFFCFNGEVKFLYVASYPKLNDHSAFFAYYSMDWKNLGIKHSLYPELTKKISKPKNFEKMVELAETLSKGFPFVRVDLYNVDGKIYCGEMTFSPDGGYAKFLDKNIDYKIGEMIDLSKIEPEYLVNDWQEIFAKYDSRL